MAEPLLFLSHAGADTMPAQALARRLEAAGIRVWFDKDNLAPGSDDWQRQIERAVGQEATCFAVYVGARGVVNWVEAEVRVALSRAISGGAPFPFIPILSANIRSAALPPFARQFEAVRDVENDPAEWTRLLQAIVQAKRPSPEPEPFFGLRAVDETRSHLFFGRRAETREIVQRIAERNLVLVAGDSGSGKSSLVLAGLVPAWRGNEVGLLRGERPSEYDWHVVVTQPRRNPRRLLAEGVEDAGRPLGLSAADLTTYAGLAEMGNVSEVRRALRCGLEGRRTRTLLVVDQFEELIHPLVPAGMQEDFAALLAELADPGDPAVAVALTMRSDYTNLLRKPELRPLYERLEANGRRARFMLGRIQPADPKQPGDLHEPDGLSAVVTKPLRLAGRSPEESTALARMVVDDVGARPGDLALVQFALTKAWDARGANDDDLLRAYAAIGRVEGALARSAEAVFQQRLGGEANEAVVSAALIRLGSLSSTGTTRRLARRAEFSEAGWKVIQELASPEGNRLVLIGGEDGAETAEIAHEALLTQWERLDAWLRADEADKRALDALAERAAASPAEDASKATQSPVRQAAGLFAWVERLFGLERPQYRQPLLQSPDLERFSGLAGRQPAWLSVAEHDLVQRSKDAVSVEARRDQQIRSLMQNGLAMLAAATLVVTLLLGVAGWLWSDARFQAKEADKQRQVAVDAQSEVRQQRDVAQQAASEAVENELRALANESSALTALSRYASATGRHFDAVKLALAAWPRNATDNRPRLPETVEALADALLRQQQLVPPMRHDGVRGAVLSGDGRRILSWGGRSEDRTVRLWDAATGRMLIPMRHDEVALGAALSTDGRRVLSWDGDGVVRLWDGTTGKELVPPVRHYHGGRRQQGFIPLGAAFSGDGNRVLSWSRGGGSEVRLWDATTGSNLVPPMRHEEGVDGAALSRNGNRILSWGRGAVRLWDAATGNEFVSPMRHEGVGGAALSRDGNRILSWGEDGAVRLWDATTGRELVPTTHHRHGGSAIFSNNEDHILSWGGDGTVRLWDAATGSDFVPPMRHEGVSGAAFSGNGNRILSWGVDGAVRLWDAATGRELVPTMMHYGIGERSQRTTGFVGAVFSGDGNRIMSWGQDDAVRLWDAVTGRELAPPIRHEGVDGVAPNHNGHRALSWGRDETVRLSDTVTGRELAFSKVRGEGVDDAALSRDGNRILSWGEDGAVRLWDAATGRELASSKVRREGVDGAAFSRDGNRILTWSSDGVLQLWDAATGNELAPPMHHEGVDGAALSDDEGRILSWGRDGAVRLWDAATGRELASSKVRREGVAGAALSRDGNRILTWSSDSVLQLWDAAAGNELAPPMHHEGVDGAALSDDEGRILSWGRDGAVRLWDAANGRELASSMRHERGGEPLRQLIVWGAALSRDGNRVLSWGGDNMVRLWDAGTGRELVPAMLHLNLLNAAFHADDRRIISWGRDTTARLWDISRLPMGNLIEVACRLLPSKDVSDVNDAYRVQIVLPICQGSPPSPAWPHMRPQ